MTDLPFPKCFQKGSLSKRLLTLLAKTVPLYHVKSGTILNSEKPAVMGIPLTPKTYFS